MQIRLQLGSVLRFPPAVTSVIWPPNALLTAALLLVPPRRWWLCIPATLLVGLCFGLPLYLWMRERELDAAAGQPAPAT